MKKRWKWNERTRLIVTLELAVVLPALALIVFSVLHLKSIQRGRGVEALMQRDFYQVLGIAEKHLNEKGYAMAEEVRLHSPSASAACSESLDALLEKYPYAAHVFIYNPERGIVFRSRQSRMGEPYFREESEEVLKDLSWLKLEFDQHLKMFREMEAKGKKPLLFEGGSVPRGEKRAYTSYAFYILPETENEGPAVGGMVFDAEYLRNQFLPEMLSELMSHENKTDSGGHGRTVMMAHMKRDSTPLAASTYWDGGTPEVEKTLEGAFPGLMLAIKLQGTTLAALGQRFVRTNFLILAGLSVLMAAGIGLTYRNVSKEVALARLKSDFVSNVSHELRTPLSLIRLYAETLEMGRLNSRDKYEEYYRIIRKESERLTALINNILDFSRIEAGRKEYDFRETDIAELVRNTLESYRYQIEQQGFVLQENIASDLPPVQVDREAISRSLVNLVNNALKYSQTEKFLGVKLYRENGSVKLEVSDRGIGIPRSEQHKIFEKFYRVGDPLVHNTKGSGLGLSLVRHIAHAHGGEVVVDSAPGEGSKFTLTLPLQSGVNHARTASA